MCVCCFAHITWIWYDVCLKQGACWENVQFDCFCRKKSNSIPTHTSKCNIVRKTCTAHLFWILYKFCWVEFINSHFSRLLLAIDSTYHVWTTSNGTFLPHFFGVYDWIVQRFCCCYSLNSVFGMKNTNKPCSHLYCICGTIRHTRQPIKILHTH